MGEAVGDTWLGNIFKSSRVSISWDGERPTLGVLAFELSRVISKVIHLWQCLSDRHMLKLREEIANSVGIQKLVSQDEDYLMDLALAEIINTFVTVAKSVAVLGKKCSDPIYQDLDGIFDDLYEVIPRWHEWQYRLKKMEKKVKKMEKFVAATEQLFSELEVLAELEQSMRRIRAGANPGKVKLLEFQQKVVWQRQEVKNLQEMSPWVRSYDYIVRLLFRSLSTIMERIKYVYGVRGNDSVEKSLEYEQQSRCLTRNNSIASLMQASICSLENNPSKFSAHLGRSLSNLGLGGDKNKLKIRKSHDYSSSSVICARKHQMKAKRFSSVGFTGCMMGGIESPVVDSCSTSCNSSFRLNGGSFRYVDGVKDLCSTPFSCSSKIKSGEKLSFFDSKRRLLSAPPSTLGHAALALHYANLILLIEKLAAAPHLISLDARDDLYNMLPASIRSCLRAKLKTFSRNLALSVYDATLAAEWSLALTRIFEWLSPLAHNMVRWQAERNVERQRLISGSNVLLVQTLYFANQVETEAAIVELLMGLNYLARFGRQVNEKPYRESSCNGTTCDNNIIPRNKMYYMIDHI